MLIEDIEEIGVVDGVIDEVDLDLVIIDKIVPVLFQGIVVDDHIFDLDLIQEIIIGNDHILALVLVREIIVDVVDDIALFQEIIVKFIFFY